jgi:hypothetical protein
MGQRRTPVASVLTSVPRREPSKRPRSQKESAPASGAHHCRDATTVKARRWTVLDHVAADCLVQAGNRSMTRMTATALLWFLSSSEESLAQVNV